MGEENMAAVTAAESRKEAEDALGAIFVEVLVGEKTETLSSMLSRRDGRRWGAVQKSIEIKWEWGAGLMR